MAYKYIGHPVHDRLYFAEQRLNDLRALNGGDFGGAPHLKRQPLLQEFFFHVCGAVDFLAQAVNIARNLGLDQEEVTTRVVLRKLTRRAPNDPITQLLATLYPKTRNKPLPADPYSEEGSHFRILVFRNFVSHIRHNPVNIAMSVGTDDPNRTYLFLDPRLPHVPTDQRTPSSRPLIDELALFLDLVFSKCNSVLTELGTPIPK